MQHPSTTDTGGAHPGDSKGKPRLGLRLATFVSLRYRDYRYLFLSIMVTAVGMWMGQIAMGWLVWELTEDPFMLGAVNGVRGVAFLVLGPWAGVAADRMDRKRLMFLSQGWVMLLSGVLSALILTGHIQVWHLFAFSLLTSMGEAFTQPVRQTLIPSLVPRADLMNAVALQSAAFNSMRVIGPSLGGVLVASIGAGGVFGIRTAGFILVLALLGLVRVPHQEAVAQRKSAGHDLIEGLHYIWSSRTLSWLILLALIPMVFAFPFQSLMPVFADAVLHVGPQGYGLLVSFIGAGALAGTLCVASLTGFERKGMLLLLSGVSLGTALFLFSRSDWMPASLVLGILIGGAQMTYMAMTQTLLHMNVTDAMRGRVMSIYMLDHGLTPVGALLAGGVASLLGAPFAVAAMGSAVAALAIIALLRVPHIRRLG